MFQPNSSCHQAINMPSTAALRLTKKTISYLEHLCTQPPPPINTTSPELTALLMHLLLLLVALTFTRRFAQDSRDQGNVDRPLVLRIRRHKLLLYFASLSLMNRTGHRKVEPCHLYRSFVTLAYRKLKLM